MCPIEVLRIKKTKTKSAILRSLSNQSVRVRCKRKPCNAGIYFVLLPPLIQKHWFKQAKKTFYSMTFENTIIKKYWPAEDKSPDGDLLPLLYIQVEAELDNSLQVGHLFTSMVKGLVAINFTHQDTGEVVPLPAATVKPFNVKQKKTKIGKGDDAAIILVEYAQMTVVTQLDADGELMKMLYPIFNRTVAMRVDDLQETRIMNASSDKSEVPVSEDTKVEII